MPRKSSLLFPLFLQIAEQFFLQNLEELEKLNRIVFPSNMFQTDQYAVIHISSVYIPYIYDIKFLPTFEKQNRGSMHDEPRIVLFRH